jgi:hypothetical protein
MTYSDTAMALTENQLVTGGMINSALTITQLLHPTILNSAGNKISKQISSTLKPIFLLMDQLVLVLEMPDTETLSSTICGKHQVEDSHNNGLS